MLKIDNVGARIGPKITINAIKSMKQPAIKKIAIKIRMNMTLLLTYSAIIPEISAGICCVVISQLSTAAQETIKIIEPDVLSAP